MPEIVSEQLSSLVSGLLLMILAAGVLGIIGWIAIMWLKWRDREEKSLKQVNLLVAVPQDNEVKIDAMEQIISSFASIYKTAKPKFVQAWISQPSASLEIVGVPK